MEKITIFALVLILMMGCAKESFQDESIISYPVFYATFDVPETKVYVSSDLKTKWTVDDRISIFTSTYNAEYKFNGKTGDDNGTFSEVGSLFSTGSELPTNYAVYPYDSETSISSEGTISLTLPETQIYGGNTSYGLGVNTMVAVTEDSDSKLLKFKSICGFLEIKLYGCCIVKSVSIKGNNSEKIAGEATVAPVYGQLPEVNVSSFGTEKITVNASGGDFGDGIQIGETIESATSFWFVIPPVTFSNGFTVTITNSEGTSISKSVSSSKTVQRNVKTSMAPIEINLGPSRIDLSSKGTANCYIVSKEGKYRFKAVKGNSSESVGDVKGVKVLWESDGQETPPSEQVIIQNDVQFIDGYIEFNTNGDIEGNAVIAAYSDANCSDGNVLWSWHIWRTDMPSEQKYNNDAGTMMDRNLGATSSTPDEIYSFGLFYQWGRKDPFLGVARSTITWPDPVETNADNGTIEYAISHPTTFIIGHWYTNDWLYSEELVSDITRWQTSDKLKGIYDPCPYGWRVPDGGENGIWAIALGTSEEWKNLSNWRTGGMDFGLTDKKLGTGTIWYPGHGYRQNNTGQQCAYYSGGYFWSCTPYNLLAHYFSCSSSGYVVVSGYDGKASGLSVRCVKEK